MKILQKIKKVFSASLLCLRFPFLYPRNRFDDKHHAYILCTPISKTYSKAIEEINITGKLHRKNENFPFIMYKNKRRFLLDKENKLLVISDKLNNITFSLKNLLGNNDRFEILGMTFRHPNVIIHVKTKDTTDNANYGFGYYRVKLLLNKIKYNWYNILKWVDLHIFDKIFFLPTYTELDAMEPGWRRAFGMQLCKELKKELKKNKYLIKYRITQIKEKYGELCWYDAGNTENGYNIIQKYTHLSQKICMKCGKPATKISCGYIAPYCDECANKLIKYDFVSINEEDAWDKALTAYWPKYDE